MFRPLKISFSNNMNFLWIFIFLLISDADETANFPEARRTCGETQWNKKYEFAIVKITV